MLRIAKKGEYNHKKNQKYIENFNVVLNKNETGNNIPFEKYFEKKDL